MAIIVDLVESIEMLEFAEKSIMVMIDKLETGHSDEMPNVKFWFCICLMLIIIYNKITLYSSKENKSYA